MTKLPTFVDSFMKKFFKARLSAIVLLPLFLGSAVACMSISHEVSQLETWRVTLHNHGGLPFSSTCQCTLDEKEKELEDKSKDETTGISLDNHAFICDFAPDYRLVEQRISGNIPFRRDRVQHSISTLPIFILDSTLII